MTSESFQTLLLQSDALQEHFVKVEGIAAKIFVKPHHKHSVLSELRGRCLRPFHVVIAASLETHLTTALENLSNKNRPRSKRADVVAYVPRETVKHCTKRTFLCEVQNLRDSNTVVQSTTEANTDAVNPRRFETNGDV